MIGRKTFIPAHRTQKAENYSKTTWPPCSSSITGSPLIELNGRLIEESQKTLARLSMAQRGYELLKSQARTSTAGDWVAARKGGPDVTRVFEAAGDPTLDTVRVPAFFTYAGFQHDFIEQLADIADRVKRDRWVLGEAGDQPALSEQLDNLPDDLLSHL